jgi:hypothetical protein
MLSIENSPHGPMKNRHIDIFGTWSKEVFITIAPKPPAVPMKLSFNNNNHFLGGSSSNMTRMVICAEGIHYNRLPNNELFGIFGCYTFDPALKTYVSLKPC